MVILVVNMIPNSLSNDINRDAEPNISVNPSNHLQIAASAFTPDPAGSGNGPIFLSNDGGHTWNLSIVLPGGNRTVDITLRFSTISNILYAGIVRQDNSNLNILRKNNISIPGLMTILVNRANDDQPYVEAATVSEGVDIGKDRVYVGHNDLSQSGSSGQTATVEVSLDAATAAPPAGFGPDRTDVRSTCNQDGPSIRPAIHANGTIYAAFFRWTQCSILPFTGDVIVVRDDSWASGPTPFRALSDTGDAQSGVRVATGVSFPFNSLLGTQRIGSQLAIAVDPRNSQTVYIAWADGTSASNYTIHVRRSTNGGATWGTADLRTITPATNPGLAINTNGTVGFLYQKLISPAAGDRWQTHLEISNDSFSTPPRDIILADVPDNNGTYTGPNPIGDYASLISLRKNFYGVFSANNTPDITNFPNGVVYQRNADFNTHTLLALDGTTPVAVSIDPFFFKVTETTDELQVIATTGNGRRLWHTIRHANGSWDQWDDVETQAGNKGPFEDIECASVNDELQVIATTGNGRRLWHTIRHANGSWDQWDDVETQAGNKGPFKKLAIG
jgi:hypothetical protein